MEDWSTQLEQFKIASRKWSKAQQSYRSCEIGDKEFLAARTEWLQNQKEFDAAEAHQKRLERMKQEFNEPSVKTTEEKAEPAALALVAQLAGLMEEMTPDQRLEVFEKLTENYCEHCGTKQSRDRWGRCQCWNDE